MEWIKSVTENSISPFVIMAIIVIVVKIVYSIKKK